MNVLTSMTCSLRVAVALCMAAAALAGSAQAQQAPATPAAPAAGAQSPAPGADGMVMMTVFLKHNQTKNLKEINDIAQRQGFFDQFPPPGVEVISWVVAMGVGHIITLKFPPEKLRDINVVLENTAWGAFNTEFHPTYDYKSAAAEQQKRFSHPRP